MKIAVIGTGNVGSVLGRRWADAGHEITFGTRDSSAERLQALLAGTGARATTAAEAAAASDVVVLATPWPATRAVVEQFGDLSGKILVDCTNPLRPDLSLDDAARPSGGEVVANWATGASVVKAFNSTGASNMSNPAFGDSRLTLLICGDDAEAKQVVAGLAGELGFEPVDNGPLSQSRFLEGLAMIWIHQAYVQGWGPDFGFVTVRR